MDLQVINSSDLLWSNSLANFRHDIYHQAEYLRIEANRLRAIPEAILVAEEGKMLFIPYLIRNCGDVVPEEADAKGIFDVVSPYGYPGILLNEAGINTPGFPDAALDAIAQEFRSRGICSAFFRLHPILNENSTEVFPKNKPTVRGRTISVDLREPNLWTHTRKGHRSTINKCKRLGMVAKMVPFADYLSEFVAIYEQTMGRVNATQGYYSFSSQYFTQMNDLLGNILHLCIVEYENQVVCAGLYTECCGIVQSTLGGTKDEFVPLSPGSLETDFARYWAQERGNEFLHLGGGVGGSTEDSLYNFKAGFSQLSHSFSTLSLIIDEQKYHKLVDLKAKTLAIATSELLDSGYFPAYRAR
jgi:hypothetical protein